MNNDECRARCSSMYLNRLAAAWGAIEKPVAGVTRSEEVDDVIGAADTELEAVVSAVATVPSCMPLTIASNKLSWLAHAVSSLDTEARSRSISSTLDSSTVSFFRLLTAFLATR